ncbi:MAG: AMP-binding protein [Opitutales bacterium]|nr:AMP-binding protein [Opitutales bacterium]MBT5167607.1 AMP-binding protein [Opitutales bacterium]MBT5813194.1 AMP-binding protein [Opitutales bacterium]MBT6767713.1 AMP-binding protein [Opitutales bacterium]MBT7866294.1 AMP-binding protein [Opitutales bacterium]
MYNGVIANNLAEMYRLAAERYGDLPVFASRVRSGVFKPISYNDLYETGLRLGTALIEIGVKQRDHVAILSDNCVEWNMVDYGTLMVGAADVPRGTDVTNQEIEYIINHSDSEVVFVENKRLLDRMITLMPQMEKVRHLVLMDRKAEAPQGILSLQTLIERGRSLREEGDRQVEDRMERIAPDDLFTLIYTSGTTGTPKGVMLTHANMASQVKFLPFLLESNDRVLSILPVWHSYERVFQMIAVSNGCCTYFTSLRSLTDDLKTVKPTMMASAPRLWENLYLRILKNVQDSHWIRRGLFKVAYFCSRMVKGSLFFLQGKKIDLKGRNAVASSGLAVLHALRVLLFLPPYVALNAVVIEKLRQIVGGSFKGTVSGGGALQPHVDEFFNYIGICVQEGYGLTETAPVIAVRTLRRLVIGTVGPLYEETELRIMDLNTGEILFPNTSNPGEGRGLKGEVHVKGPQVMKGYFKNEDATSRVLKDGWLNTGDIGIYTYNDCLKIVGRSKDTIVLLNGENLEPIPIEAKLCESPLIDQCMIVGQDQKQLGALVVPSLEGFANQGFSKESVAALAEDSEAHDRIVKEAKRLISNENGFKTFEHIHGIALLPKPFEVGEEMTNTFKIKRHVVDEKYGDLIGWIFS